MSYVQDLSNSMILIFFRTWFHLVPFSIRFCYTARGGFCYSEEDILEFQTGKFLLLSSCTVIGVFVLISMFHEIFFRTLVLHECKVKFFFLNEDVSCKCEECVISLFVYERNDELTMRICYSSLGMSNGPCRAR